MAVVRKKLSAFLVTFNLSDSFGQKQIEDFIWLTNSTDSAIEALRIYAGMSKLSITEEIKPGWQEAEVRVNQEILPSWRKSGTLKVSKIPIKYFIDRTLATGPDPTEPVENATRASEVLGP